jgi:CRP/FNR family transcriptional regulator, cyclic AMP receptor protein
VVEWWRVAMANLETMLGSVDTFKGLSPAEIREIARIGNDVEFAAGSSFVEEGLQGADFYLILEGQARLQVPKKEPRTIGPGESLGEISVLDGGPRTATVTAETRVLAFRIGRDEFLPLLDRHGSIGRKILVEMCGRLRYAESRMSE